MIIDKKVISKCFKNFGAGAAIGGSMLIPGVSGGTAAIILGIYDELISSVSRVFKEPLKSLFILFSVGGGVICGAWLLSGAVLQLISAYPVFSRYFFIGAILASVPMLTKKSQISKNNLYDIVFVLLGAGLAIGIRFLPESTAGNSGFFQLVLSGMIIAAAVVLPGISTSHVLLVTGMYESVWGALNRTDFGLLLPIIAGGIIGTFLTAGLTEKAQKKFPSPTYMTIIGFVMTSVYDIIPRTILIIELPACLILCILGFMGVFFLTRNISR